MLAGYLVAPQRVEVREEERPHAGPGELVIAVRVALTDGTDLKAYRRGHPQMPMPTRFGHEFAGDVVDVGAGVAAFSRGDAVMAVHSAPCTLCYWCTHDQEQLCEQVMRTKILGAYAEYIAIPRHIVANNVYLKPEQLSYEAAAFLEPLACVVHSAELLQLRGDESVVVIGAGGFGLLHLMVLRALGLPKPLLVVRRPERRALAQELNLAHVVDAAGDPIAVVRAATGGRGADLVIECTGSPAVWEEAASYVRRGGTLSLFGGLPGGTQVTFDAGRLHYDEVRVLSPFHFGRRAVRRAYELLTSGTIDPRPLVSGAIPLLQLADAFALLQSGHGIKYAVIP